MDLVGWVEWFAALVLARRVWVAAMDAVRKNGAGGVSLWWLCTLALAWETDPLTERDEPIVDSAAFADAFTSEIIDEAIERTNRRLGCGANPDEVRDMLAREIYLATSPRKRLPGRGLQGMGHGQFSAWLESSPDVDRRSFDDRRDLFHDVRFGQSFILSSAGTCSMVNLGGIIMGTDKPDHFWYGGYSYYLIARERGEQAAIAYGTKTELTYYGLMTSSTFSFGDLHANWQGYLFFRDLLREGSVVGLDAQRCAARTRPFSWAEWTDWRWDEALNPNVYTPKIDAYVSAELDRRQPSVCADVAPILDQVRQHLPAALTEQPVWVGKRAPERVDPFRLLQRCGDGLTTPDPHE